MNSTDSIEVLCCGDGTGDAFEKLQLAPGDLRLNQIPESVFFKENFFSHAQSLIVIFGKGCDFIKLCHRLADNGGFGNYAFKLCVFCFPLESDLNDLPFLFNDFIFFPCSPSEFHWRLRALERFQTNKNTATSFNQQAVLEEFANLNLHGSSSVFIDTLNLLKKTAKCDASVLIEGETGTGKENAARAIHYLGQRRDKAFIPINCGAIPDSLLESELFGYEKGAFTDAKQKQRGLVALADGGTLFLDEVDSLSPRAQAALLRFLQTGEYRPLGSGKNRQSNVRIVAATNARLPSRVKEKKFREDLYFRLNVFSVHIPPLRERPEDIAVIVRYLIQKYSDRYGRGPSRVNPSTLMVLQNRSWPGNVRELENVVLREFLLASGDEIVLSNDRRINTAEQTSVIKDDESPLPFQQAKDNVISKFENDYLQKLLAITAGNVSEAARICGKERRAFGKLLKKYNIDREQFQNHCSV